MVDFSNKKGEREGEIVKRGKEGGWGRGARDGVQSHILICFFMHECGKGR